MYPKLLALPQLHEIKDTLTAEDTLTV